MHTLNTTNLGYGLVCRVLAQCAKALGQSPIPDEPGTAAHGCNTAMAALGRERQRGHMSKVILGYRAGFKASLGYIERPCIRNKLKMCNLVFSMQRI